MSRWSEIWGRRSVDAEAMTLEALLRLDGFDSGAATVDTAAFVRFGEQLAGRLGMAPADTVFEVGCGAGALLHVFHGKGYRVGGIDLSPALVAAARRAMPGMAFTVSDASAFQSGPQDFVLSNGVFHYFSDLGYARQVVERMLATAKKGIAILDVPDIERREASEAYRRGTMPPGEYDARYRGLEHLYFRRDWFAGLDAARGWRVHVEDQWLETYGNAPFRFNVLFIREGAA